ncbi:MAG: penicillin-insensitive murein endopeptidase [Acidobacteriaceae bacterium]|jgi:penicillin-insensitive murein endopeptidase|nr:penicillin-insensitive murein endopeptidase [Acidobacteriaceae bacterium]
MRRRLSAFVLLVGAMMTALLVLVSTDLAAQRATSPRPAPTPPRPANSPSTPRAKFAEWARITDPLPGPASAIGFYSAGCLQGAEPLPLDGDGYSVMRPSRRHYYAHPSLLAYLTQFASAMYARDKQFLLIGDIAPPRGGPMLTGHVSHQNGLDADIWFTTRATRPTNVQREQLGAPTFVTGRKTLKPTWGAAQAKLLAAAADNDEVNRIFVSPPIKRYMCKEYPKAAWLYRIRPWWGHEEHFHVRLVCPAENPLCNEQDGLNPADNGCGADLDWWFSAEADRDWQRLSTSTEPRSFPDLPPQCAAMPAPRSR